jgi:hypothetical protein
MPTVQELAVAVGELTLEDEELAEEAIAIANALVAQYLGFDPMLDAGAVVTATERVILGPDTRYVQFTSPALSIDNAEIDGSAVDVTNYETYVDLGSRHSSGVLEITYGAVPNPLTVAEQARVDKIVFRLAVKVYAQYAERAGGVSSLASDGERIDFEEVFADGSLSQAASVEKTLLNQYRRTITMGKRW